MPRVEFVCILLLSFVPSAVAFAQEADAPAYLKHGSDPVQDVYSKALLGFAFEHKCSFLTEAMRADYERHLNLATEVFRGYVLAKGMAQSPVQAVNYPMDMALGAARAAGRLNCDARARESVSIGFEKARDFLSLIDGELRKPLR